MTEVENFYIERIILTCIVFIKKSSKNYRDFYLNAFNFQIIHVLRNRKESVAAVTVIGCVHVIKTLREFLARQRFLSEKLSNRINEKRNDTQLLFWTLTCLSKFEKKTHTHTHKERKQASEQERELVQLINNVAVSITKVWLILRPFISTTFLSIKPFHCKRASFC